MSREIASAREKSEVACCRHAAGPSNHAHIFDWLLERVYGAERGERGSEETHARGSPMYTRPFNVQSNYSLPIHRIDERPAEKIVERPSDRYCISAAPNAFLNIKIIMV